MPDKELLVYGYGNPSRGDDGAGFECVERIKDRYQGVETDYNLQLGIEDAVDIVRYKRVVFVDAAQSGEEPYSWKRLAPDQNISFSSHVLGPGSVLAVAQDMYANLPETWLLAIRGYDFGYADCLTEGASANVAAALDFLIRQIKEWEASKHGTQ